jgi:CO dehydrogenase maturation factor
MAGSAEEQKRAVRNAAGLLRTRGPGGGGTRIVITGKGGAGKTTLTALLCRLFAGNGRAVLAVDEDPQQNLVFSLGHPPDKAAAITPIAENADYIEEKVGARPDRKGGQLIALNPDISDVVDRFGVRIDGGIRVLVMGSVPRAGTGCLCPENALLTSIVRGLHLGDADVVLMDTQAGVEHFGRAIAEGFGQTIIVTEPTFNSLQVALRSAELARDLGIPVIHLVVNKSTGPRDMERVAGTIGEFDRFASVSFLPFDAAVMQTEPDVGPLLERPCPFSAAVFDLFRAVWDACRR